MAYVIPAPTNFSTTPDVSSTYGVPMAFISGFEMKYVSNTVFTVSSGNANAENNGSTIQYPSVNPGLPANITVDITQLASAGLTQGNQILPGTSGVFPVSIASLGLTSFTTFAVYVISDSSGRNSPIVVVATGDNFIPGVASPARDYDSMRRIGFITIDDATGFILPFIQSGSFTDREYIYANAIPVLSTGASQTVALVDLSLNDAPIVPGPTSKVKLRSLWLPAAAADTSSLTPTGLTSTTYPVVLQNAAALGAQENFELIPGIDGATGHAGINYINSAAAGALSLWVVGFTDSLRLQVV